MAMRLAKESFTKQKKEEITVDEDAIKIEKDEEKVPQNVDQNGKLKWTEDKSLNNKLKKTKLIEWCSSVIGSLTRLTRDWNTQKHTYHHRQRCNL